MTVYSTSDTSIGQNAVQGAFRDTGVEYLWWWHVLCLPGEWTRYLAMVKSLPEPGVRNKAVDLLFSL